MKKLLLATLAICSFSAFASSCDNLVGTYSCDQDRDQMVIEKKDGLFDSFYFTFPKSDGEVISLGKDRVKGSCSKGVLTFSKRYLILGFDPMKTTATFSKNSKGELVVKERARTLFQGRFPESETICKAVN